MFKADCNNLRVKHNVAGCLSLRNHVMQTRPVPITRKQKSDGRALKQPVQCCKGVSYRGGRRKYAGVRHNAKKLSQAKNRQPPRLGPLRKAMKEPTGLHVLRHILPMSVNEDVGVKSFHSLPSMAS